ncbi:MAG: phosphoribosylanthranilate isomerase [Lachnospiraceae bacterium]|nr:phosphoribosylanthranilate isomerase [Lachnospiraceae bacterium]
MGQSVQLKICGLRRLQDVEYVNELMPDFVGFIFAPSKRQLTKEQAAELAKKIHPNIKRVGVFVNQPVDFAVGLLADGVIQYAQLHGGENAPYISDLRQQAKLHGVDAKIIKAVRVRSQEDLIGVEDIDCEYLLLDAWSEEGQAAGGNGKTFDWSLIRTINKPFFLAGGLHPKNVGTAIRDVQPFGIDASSCMETDGYKDFDKMKEFVEAVRGASENGGIYE